MKKDTFWFWILIALLVLGMLATLWFGRGRTRHGYGDLIRPAPGSDPTAMVAGIERETENFSSHSLTGTNT